MTISSFDFTTPIIRDFHYLRFTSPVPAFQIKTVNNQEGCLKIQAQYFNPGMHIVVHHSHTASFGVPTLEQAEEEVLKINWDLGFYRAILGKLSLTEEHLYVMTIITQAVACDEKLLYDLKGRIKELRKSDGK